MKYKTTHIKIMSLLLTIVMVLSTAMVFAVDEEPAQDADASETVEVITDEATDPAQLLQDSNENEEVVVKRDAAKGVEDTGEGGDTGEEPVEVNVTVIPDAGTIKIGDTIDLTASIENEPEGAVVSWASEGSAVTIAPLEGSVTTVTGVSAGPATITASVLVDGEVVCNGSCIITVEDDSFTAVAPVVTLDKKYKSGYESAKDNGYYVKWTHSDKTGVTGYQILCDGKVVVNNIQPTETQREVLVPAGTHNYIVKAIGANNKSIQSAAAKVSISGVITSTHAYTWYCTTKKKVKAGGVTIPKGTRLTAVGRFPAKIKKFKNPKKVQVVYKNKKVWIPYKSLKGGVKAVVNVKQDYSRSLKEYMINSKNFTEALKGKPITSRTNYVIWACLYTQRAYTFQKVNGKWSLIHTDRITTGKFSHPTRSSETSGIYTVQKKVAGKVWMVQENGKRYYFTHASYITSGISFHTGTWWASGKTRGTIKANGQPGTYGCIRMKTDGAKYIFGKTTVGKTGVIVTRFH